MEDAMKRLPFPGGRTADSGMGHFHVSVQVGQLAGGRVARVQALVDTGATYTWIPRDSSGGRVARVQALVDTGATYTWIPRDVLEGLGVVPEEEWPFVLADGREVYYPRAWISIGMRDRVQPTIVVFGEPGSEPILGVVTLEEFRVAA